MYTKYNNNIICQVEMIDTRSNIFDILSNSMNINKSLPLLKQFLKHDAHL